ATIARIRELETKLPPLEGRLRDLQAATSKARATLAARARSEPNRGFPEYADKKAIAAWENSLAEAQAALTAAQRSESELVGEYNSVVDSIGKEREKLNGHRAHIGAVNDSDRMGLVEQESRLLAQIEGKPWTDGATGLSTKP